MRWKHVGILCLFVLALGGAAVAELPPLIDRELFFGDPEISSAQLSPDGTYMSFIKPYRDVRNIYVKKLDEPFEAARPVTADERPVPGYFWSRDGKFLMYVQDKGGNENFHIYAVDPSAAPEAATGVPPARDLTPIENVRAAIYAVPENKPREIIAGLNDRDAAYHDVYRIDIATGERTLLIQNTQKVGSWIFDLEGDVRLAYRQKDDGGNEVLSVDGDNLTRIYDVTYLESAYPIRFHKDGKRVYVQTNKGDGVDLSQLVLMDASTGATSFVESDPEKQVDFGGAVFDPATEELVATTYLGDRLRVYPKTEDAKRDWERMRKKLPKGEHYMGSTTEDARYSLVSVQSDIEPGATYLYDREKGTFTLQYRVRPQLDPTHLATMQAIRYKARDGLEIPAYLTLPRGVPAKNLPLVLHPHGGPWARDSWGYDGYAQFLANRGYAVLQPNFRASTGYGKKFLNAGNKEWGTGAMQHDLTDGVKHLIAKGIADPARVAIFGGSYGGYATLAGVTFTPELYKCGVPYVAPSNLITLIESFPAYWRPFMKGSWYMRVGDPADAKDRADLEARSPLSFVDRIRVPLLVIHGANDPRVKQFESDQIVVALRDKGAEVEYLVAPDEGHGFRAPGNRMASAVAIEKFLAKQLGGRAQEDVPGPVAKRLGEITVDVASVKLPESGDSGLAEKAKSAPLPKADGNLLAPVTLQYSYAYDVSGHAMTIEVTRSIAAVTTNGRACWRVTDTGKSPMGEMSDAFDIDRATLEPVAREAKGMGSMKFAYAKDAIRGEMGAGGQMLPVDMKLAAPVFGDGPGFEATVAALPLAVGYETTYRVFDPMTQKVRTMALRVTGEEKMSLAGSDIAAFVVAMKALDGDESGTGTLHVLQAAPHHVVKSSYKLPAAMGGGTVTAELTTTEPVGIGAR